MFGVGAGYLEPEFRALGANFMERGAVTDEYLDAMATLWYGEHPEDHGRLVDFAGVDAHHRPVQRPIPLVVAGHSGPAYRRAVARAQGWHGYWLTPDDVATSLVGLRAAADRVERPAGLDALEISVTPVVGSRPTASFCGRSALQGWPPPRRPASRTCPPSASTSVVTPS